MGTRLRRGARFGSGSLLRARQPALTRLSPHNANNTHLIPNREHQGVPGVGVDNLLLEDGCVLLLETGDALLLE